MATTVAVCAYNEAANISRLLERVLASDPQGELVSEVIVVSSGSTDGTDEVVAALGARQPRLRLIQEPERRGKAAAVNVVLREAKNDAIILADADTLPAEETVGRLVRGLQQPGVGGIGTRNVPVNGDETLIARVAALLWDIHDRVSREHPVLGGDIVAFRRLVPALPVGSINDDYVIERELRCRGWAVAYDPQAVTYMRVPTNLRDFLRQRRRIHLGFLQLGIRPRPTKATQDLRRVVPATLRILRERPGEWPLVLLLGCLSLTGKALGYLDFLLGRSQAAWAPSPSTKERIDLPAAGAPPGR